MKKLTFVYKTLIILSVIILLGLTNPWGIIILIGGFYLIVFLSLFKDRIRYWLKWNDWGIRIFWRERDVIEVKNREIKLRRNIKI